MKKNKKKKRGKNITALIKHTERIRRMDVRVFGRDFVPIERTYRVGMF